MEKGTRICGLLPDAPKFLNSSDGKNEKWCNDKVTSKHYRGFKHAKIFYGSV